MTITAKPVKKAIVNPKKVRYEPSAGERFLLQWVAAMRSGEFPKLPNPSVALRGPTGEYSASGVICELIRRADHPRLQWNTRDELFNTYTIDGYAFELPIWCVNYLTNAGLSNQEVITIIDLCYDVDQAKEKDLTFNSASAAIEKVVNGWIKDKSAELSITDAEWDEIYLVCKDVVDLTKGKLTASDWKKISSTIRAKGVDTHMGSWRGFMGRLGKKIGNVGERAAAQYKEVPTKVVARIARLNAIDGKFRGFEENAKAL